MSEGLDLEARHPASLTVPIRRIHHVHGELQAESRTAARKRFYAFYSACRRVSWLREAIYTAPRGYAALLCQVSSGGTHQDAGG